MKVLVTCIPQAGHLNPMLPLITALVRAGDEVVVATGAGVRDQVEAAGARFAPAGSGMDSWFGALAGRIRGVPGDGLPPDRIPHYFAPRLFGEIASADMIDAVLAVGDSMAPDLVLFDAEAFHGPLVATLLGSRQANHHFGPLLAPDVSRLVTDAMSPLWRAFGRDVPADAGMYQGATIAVCPPSLDPALPRDGVELMLRPAPLPLRPPRPQAPPLVYFSLGTMWANPAVVSAVFAAVERLPVRVVATVPAPDPTTVAVPDNVELHEFLPQAQVLPDASLVVHHAGAGTMFGALAHGLPQLALPQAADNFINADLLARSEAAITLLPDQADPDAIAAAVSHLLEHSSARAAAQRLADEIANMPSAEAVAAELRAG